MRRITTSMMLNKFQSTYPLLAKEQIYCHQFDGLKLCFYFRDGSYAVYDYIENKIEKIFYPNEENTHQVEIKDDYDSKEDYEKYFSKNLKGWMFHRNINSLELSKKAGISHVTLSRYLNGKRVPDMYTASKLAKVLGCSLEDLNA